LNKFRKKKENKNNENYSYNTCNPAFTIKKESVKNSFSNLNLLGSGNLGPGVSKGDERSNSNCSKIKREIEFLK